jgi:hypothetical protein
MYGNYEYGVVTYGDSYSITTTVIIITPGQIDVIFTACRRSLSFLSQDKIDLFFSLDPNETTFIAKKKETEFISINKKNSFISSDKTGNRCNN